VKCQCLGLNKLLIFWLVFNHTFECIDRQLFIFLGSRQCCLEQVYVQCGCLKVEINVIYCAFQMFDEMSK